MTPDILTSPALEPLRHGFFGRRGGVSEGIYAALNCGPGSADRPEAVAENRARAAAALGADPGSLVSLHQVHSAEVVTLDHVPAGPRPRADGMVTATPGLALAVLTADCQPVLFADPGAGVIGAAHGGWRGTLDGVLEATLAAMQRLGARLGSIRAVIGPTIGPGAYEVGPEFVAAFRAADPGNGRFFAPGRGDRALFDLPAYGLHRLRAAGVGHAEWTGHCTHSDRARFFSYRRSVQAAEPDYGRLISIIRL